MNLKETVQHQRIALLAGGVVLVCALGLLCIAAWAWAYRDTFYPGVSVGSVPLSGLSFEDGRRQLNEQLSSVLDAGVPVSLQGPSLAQDVRTTLQLRTLAASDVDASRDLAVVELTATVKDAWNVGREGALPKRLWSMLHAALAGKTFLPPITLDMNALQAQLDQAFAGTYELAVEPSFRIVPGSSSAAAWDVTVTPGRAGTTARLNEALERLKADLRLLAPQPLQLTITNQEPIVSAQEAATLIPTVEHALATAPFTLKTQADRSTFTYTLASTTLANALTPIKRDGVVLLSTSEALDPLWERIEQDVNVEARNARFRTDGRHVEEFAPSIAGRQLNREASQHAIEQAFLREATCTATIDETVCTYDAAIDLVVDTTQAQVTTGSVNDLGITEILGVGTSNFKGSPKNRIANIRHGVSKLNGTLIAPDEEFSLLSALKPFTIEDGYLPELVIKGDEIKPEVAGGLCQIGSTTFRAAMNTGLDITQRQNHSLVVSYYNDPSNGNPGTDATIYDPAPDFRFMNDTGNYLLLTTDMNLETSELTFTFWGTSDGRKGYYSAPVVRTWIPAGETKTTYTTDLEPGKKTCQSAHPGASTSFTYYVERPDGEVSETVYDSYYRPLPQICLVGVAPEELDAEGKYIPPEERLETPEPTPDPPLETGTPTASETPEVISAPTETPEP